MLVVQKSRPHKLGLGGDKWKSNYNKCNNFVTASTSGACIGESSKRRAKLKDTKAFKRHYAKKKSTKPKYGNPKSRRIMHPNPNLKGIVCNYCGKRDMLKQSSKCGY